MLNLEDAFERVDNDKELYLDLLNFFFSDGQFDFELFKKFVNNNKKLEAANLIHRLKGAMGSLGCEKAVSIAGDIESVLRNNLSSDNLEDKIENFRIVYEKTILQLKDYLEKNNS